MNAVGSKFYSFVDGEIWLHLIYAKNKDENIPAHILETLKEELEP